MLAKEWEKQTRELSELSAKDFWQSAVFDNKYGFEARFDTAFYRALIVPVTDAYKTLTGGPK